MNDKQLQASAISDPLQSALMANYARQPVSFVRGEGSWLFDSDGRKYLDGLCGISVTNLGHCHPAITEVIRNQSTTLLHTSNLFHIESQEELGAALCRLSGMDRAFFSNSGAEANEAAVKLARLYAHEHGQKNPLILSFEGSFHGRTLGMIAATAGDKVKTGFDPLLPGFLHLPFNDTQALQKAFAEHDNIAAVMLEPVQGEGGIHLASQAFIDKVAELSQQYSREHKILLIADEVQSGNGRCGSYFAMGQMQANGLKVKPDIVTTAKALGNGLPIGACMARAEIAEFFVPGKHGSTFGGNPFCSRVALEVTRQIESASLDARALQLGKKLTANFKNSLGDLPWVQEIRSQGLMIGIALTTPCPELVAQALADDLVINVTAGNVIRLLPPLVMSDAECDLLCEKVITLVKTYEA